MDVTKKNFQSVLPVFQAAVDSATYVAVDCEFSGLPDGVGGGASQLDTPARRYRRLRAGLRQVAVLQCGVSTFSVNPATSRVSHRSFNFNLFPRQHSGAISCQNFQCQPSALEFLVANKFDFNKVICEGIGHLRPDDEQTMLTRLLASHKHTPVVTTGDEAVSASPTLSSCHRDSQRVSHVVVPELYRSFVERSASQLQQFLQSNDQYFDFENLNGFQRKLLYEHVETNYANTLELSTQKTAGVGRVLRATRAPSDEEKVKRSVEKRRQLEQQIEEMAGFSRIVQIISKSGKMVVGHNMLLDMMLLVHHYVHQLPYCWHQFTNILHHQFPRLIDTKLMSSLPPFRDLLVSTALSDLTHALSLSPFKLPPLVSVCVFEDGVAGGSYRMSDKRCHEAGYDSYMTGVSLAGMLAYMGKMQSPAVKILSLDHRVISLLENRLYVCGVYDYNHLCVTADPQAMPCRRHIVHVQFPEHWRHADLTQLFADFGSVSVIWIDTCSAFIVVTDGADTAARAISSLTHRRPAVIVQSYDDYIKAAENGHNQSGEELVSACNSSQHITDRSAALKRREFCCPSSSSRTGHESCDITDAAASAGVDDECSVSQLHDACGDQVSASCHKKTRQSNCHASLHITTTTTTTTNDAAVTAVTDGVSCSVKDSTGNTAAPFKVPDNW